MLALIYLFLALVRLFVSKLDSAQRKLLFFCRFAVFVCAVVLSPFVLVISAQLGFNRILFSYAEVLFVIAIGEHLIYNDLTKRGVLPEGVPRLPLGV